LESNPITSPSIWRAISTARVDFPLAVGPTIVMTGVFEIIELIEREKSMNFFTLFQTAYPIRSKKVE